MSLAILFHFLCAQHVSDINICIIRSWRRFCWITTLVVLFLVWLCWRFCRFGLEWYPCCSLKHNFSLQHRYHSNQTQPHRISNRHRTKNNTNNVVIQHNSHKLMMMDKLMSETCWAHKKWNKIASDNKLVFYSSKTNILKFSWYSYHTFSYIPHFNQHNAPTEIK